MVLRPATVVRIEELVVLPVEPNDAGARGETVRDGTRALEALECDCDACERGPCDSVAVRDTGVEGALVSGRAVAAGRALVAGRGAGGSARAGSTLEWVVEGGSGGIPCRRKPGRVC